MDNANFALPKPLKPVKKTETKCTADAPKKEVSADEIVKNDEINEATSQIENNTISLEKSVQPSVEPIKDFKTPVPIESAGAPAVASTKEPANKTPDPPIKSSSEHRKAKVERKKKPEPEVVVLQYKEPKWSGPASFPYTLEVLKGGKILEEVWLIMLFQLK